MFTYIYIYIHTLIYIYIDVIECVTLKYTAHGSGHASKCAWLQRHRSQSLPSAARAHTLPHSRLARTHSTTPSRPHTYSHTLTYPQSLAVATPVYLCQTPSHTLTHPLKHSHALTYSYETCLGGVKRHTHINGRARAHTHTRRARAATGAAWECVILCQHE